MTSIWVRIVWRAAASATLASSWSSVSWAQGAVGPNASAGADAQIPKCDKPLGVMAVVEPQDAMQQALASFKLGSPTGVLRLMIQQSNCFLVAERGMAMQNLMQERQLASGGQLQQGSNVGGAQMVAVDFLLTPAVVFSERNAGGGGFFGAAIRRVSPLAGAIAGGLKFKEAQTSLLLADARSGLQVASAEGRAKKTDFGLGGLGASASGVAALGAYTNTNEGKVIVASFANNYAKIVEVVRGDSSLQQQQRTVKEEAAKPIEAGAAFQEGDVLAPKIAGVRLMAQPRDSAKIVTTLTKADELVFLGKEQDGYVHVQASTAQGWVRKVTLLRK